MRYTGRMEHEHSPDAIRQRLESGPKTELFCATWICAENRFVQVTNKAVYPPQEKTIQGRTHQDLGFFGYELPQRRLGFRQFHVEGFVVQYSLENILRLAGPAKCLSVGPTFLAARMKRARSTSGLSLHSENFRIDQIS